MLCWACTRSVCLNPEILTKQVSLIHAGRHPNIFENICVSEKYFWKETGLSFWVFLILDVERFSKAGEKQDFNFSESMFNFETCKAVRIQEKVVAVLNMNCINEKRARILSCKWLWVIPSNYNMHTSHFSKEENRASSGWKKFRHSLSQQLINSIRPHLVKNNVPGSCLIYTLQNTMTAAEVTFLLKVVWGQNQSKNVHESQSQTSLRIQKECYAFNVNMPTAPYLLKQKNIHSQRHVM